MSDTEQVIFEMDGPVALSRPEATLLAEKLRGYADGQFPADVNDLEALGVDRGWLSGALPAADTIEAVLTDARSGPIPLDAQGKAADAVFAVLRLTGPTAFDAQSGFARLHQALERARA